MNEEIKKLHRFGNTVLHSAKLKSSRNILDVFADRIRQSSMEPTLMLFGQKLCDLMNVETSKLYAPAIREFMDMCSLPNAFPVLKWVRENHTLFSVLCTSKFEDADEAIKSIVLKDCASTNDSALPRRPYGIPIKAEVLTPLSHGSDIKSGNATLFRRMSVLGRNGSVMSLPYYAGNAIRGQIRDILADHLTSELGLNVDRAKPPYSLWFFHSLYSGGALEEVSASTKAITTELGSGGSVKAEGIRKFRDMLPTLSLLGAAMGNKIISGHADFGDWRPVCQEWGNGGSSSVNDIFAWLYLTRREDHEDHEKHSGMIATTEALKAGTLLEGGVDMRLHIGELSRSALGLGIELLIKRGRIGAQNRADFGSVNIQAENIPDSSLYQKYLKDNRSHIIEYLNTIGALNAHDKLDL